MLGMCLWCIVFLLGRGIIMKSIKEISILGVNIAVTNMNEVKDFICNDIDRLSGEYICVSNVHTTVMSYEQPKYRNVQNSAILRLPDGRPLSLIAKKRGHKEAERVTGPDLMEELFKFQSNVKHYFYGSTPETLELLKKELTEKYPNLDIVGMYSPPFRKLTEEEDNDIINMINDSKADIVWVGLGAPKQENWMYDHKNKINALMIGVGAGFDYHAQKIKRAPKWMQRLSLEWLYRLCQEPKRLFSRYMKTNFKFIRLVMKEK